MEKAEVHLSVGIPLLRSLAIPLRSRLIASRYAPAIRITIPEFTLSIGISLFSRLAVPLRRFLIALRHTPTSRMEISEGELDVGLFFLRFDKPFFSLAKPLLCFVMV